MAEFCSFEGMNHILYILYRIYISIESYSIYNIYNTAAGENAVYISVRSI